MSWSRKKELQSTGLHREHFRHLEQCLASQQQCLAKAAGVVDAGIWSIMKSIQRIAKDILVHGEGSPHLCRPVFVGDATRPASARTVHARSLQCAHDPRRPDL
jgi:hypothetical protein